VVISYVPSDKETSPCHRHRHSDLKLQREDSVWFPYALELQQSVTVIGAIAGATVTIGANYLNGQDVLAFTDQLGITGSWNARPKEMVSQMKPGAIIIDVSIDQGGCFETSRPTTHKNPVFKVHGITHYCVPNIPSKVPHTASQALSNIFVPIILDIGSEGGIENLVKTDQGVRQGVYLFNGTSTNQFISKNFNLPFQDMDLLMAAFH